MLRRIVMIFILIDNFIMNLLKRPFSKRWVLKGKCKQCGRCCHEIGLAISPKFLESTLITDIIIRWISWIFNFHMVRIEYDRCLVVFNCRTLTPEGKCGDYKWRPNVCRNYPIEDYFAKPSIYEGTCGFSAELSK